MKIYPPGSSLLDVGTGTGALAGELLGRGSQVVGIDISEEMISVARRKFKIFPNSDFLVAQAEKLPFQPMTFDGVVSAFVIRNLHHAGNLLASFKEFHRVIKPGGIMAHLELTRPKRGPLLWGYSAYSATILPTIGRVLFRGRWPGNYLRDTIRRFPAPEQINDWLRSAGFSNLWHTPLSGGIACLFTAQKCSI